MITGDHALTAAAIARELGLEGAVLTGAELDRIDVAELSRHIEATARTGQRLTRVDTGALRLL